MKRVLIIYNSRTGITKGLSYQLEMVCRERGYDTRLVSIEKFSKDMLEDASHIFLGCWTHGLMIMFQHPDKQWVRFARVLPDLTGRKIVLFTTYKLASGTMFRNMRRHLKCRPDDIVLELKSRDTSLSEANRASVMKVLGD